jgi:hypothetical protein
MGFGKFDDLVRVGFERLEHRGLGSVAAGSFNLPVRSRPPAGTPIRDHDPAISMA